MEITLKDVQGFLEQNRDSDEVKAFTGSFINKDSVASFLDSEDAQEILQPRLDTYHSQNLDAWKQQHLQALIDEKVNELNPPETEEAKQLRELQKQVKTMEREKALADIKVNALGDLQAKGLPSTLVELVMSDDLKATKGRITALEAEFKNAVKASVEDRLKGMGGTPKGDAGEGHKALTKESFHNMSYDERLKLYQENPQLFAELNG